MVNLQACLLNRKNGGLCGFAAWLPGDIGKFVLKLLSVLLLLIPVTAAHANPAEPLLDPQGRVIPHDAKKPLPEAATAAKATPRTKVAKPRVRQTKPVRSGKAAPAKRARR